MLKAEKHSHHHDGGARGAGEASERVAGSGNVIVIKLLYGHGTRLPTVVTWMAGMGRAAHSNALGTIL